MAVKVAELAERCLRKSKPISMKQDILGVYGSDHPQTRSVLERLRLVQNSPFIRVAVVTITDLANGVSGPAPNLQRDIDETNAVYFDSCGIWIYCTGVASIDDPELDSLQIHDCLPPFHVSSPEEFRLFSLGRNLGAAIVAYYVSGSNRDNSVGCAAHPDGQKGFWLLRNARSYAFAHELGHVVAFSSGRFNMTGHSPDPNNVMFAQAVWDVQPIFSVQDCEILQVDEDVERC